MPYTRADTECINGHPFDEENTVWRLRMVNTKKKGKRQEWRRQCRECLRAAMRRYRERKKIMALYQEVSSD